VDLRRRNINFEALTVEIERFIGALPAGTVPVTIGGDHSISLPLVRALKRKIQEPLTVVSFDHHMDIQYWDENLDALYHTNVMSHIIQVIGDGNLMHIGINP
jgi:arginase family enzyme